jgi:gamma-glutamylputrescine oxidase
MSLVADADFGRPPNLKRKGEQGLLLASDDPLVRSSYYEASVERTDRHSPLQIDIACDVCVVGAGLAGLSAAIDLADAGFTVAVLEARQVGWGASGRNGGQALVGLACDMQVIERQLGRPAARQIWDTTVEAVELIHSRCRRFGIDCEWQDGFVAAAVTPRRAGELAPWVETLARDYGYDRMRLIDRAELPQWIASSRYRAAAFDSGSGHMHPLKYTLGLARAALSLGVKIFEGSQAIEVRPGRLAEVRTPRARVHCSHVLLAGNVYLQHLMPQLATRIMPVGTFIAASRSLGAERAAQLLPRGVAVSDTQWVLDYFRLSRDHRMLFGGRVSYSTILPWGLPEAMRRRMLGVFPQLADVPIEFAWGGYVDITMNRAPDFGRVTDNVYYLQGFSGHGLALTGLAGRIVSEAIRGTASRFDLFAGIKHRDFPGGRWLRTPLLVLAMAWYRIRDLIG